MLMTTFQTPKRKKKNGKKLMQSMMKELNIGKEIQIQIQLRLFYAHCILFFGRKLIGKVLECMNYLMQTQ